MTILGIDPGSARMGYGLIEVDRRVIKFLSAGTIVTKGKTVTEKIATMGADLEKLILETKPDRAGVEKIFFAKNRKTAIEVAEARGVILFLLNKHGVPIFEPAPNEVKATVAGDGSADKMAVAKMVGIILNKPKLAGYDDTTDALAIAISAIPRRGQ